MPIDILCSACGQRLRVADAHAGKRARCPKCQAVIDVPAAGTVLGWTMRTPEGQEFGPVDRQTLDNWRAEGRITPTCQLRAPGAAEWVPAVNVYADLVDDLGDDQPLILAQSAQPDLYEVVDTPRPPALRTGVQPLGVPTLSPRGGPRGLGNFRGTDVHQALAQTRPWVLFQGIVGMMWGVLSFFITAMRIGTLIRFGGGLGGIVLLFSLAVMGIAVYAAYLLVQYASRTKEFLSNGSPVTLEEALAAQQKYWLLMGVLMIVVVLMVILGALAGGLA